MDKVNILGVHVDMVNISQATDCIMRFLDEDKFHAVYTPNSEIIMLAYKDEKFCKLLNNADLLTADGIGVVHASKILKKPISERAAGYDIARQVLQKMNYTDHKLFLFGGKPGVAEEAKKKLLEEYTDLNIVGTRNGYFKPEEEAEIVEEINNSGADIVFVCLGAPKHTKTISAPELLISSTISASSSGLKYPFLVPTILRSVYSSKSFFFASSATPGLPPKRNSLWSV